MARIPTLLWLSWFTAGADALFAQASGPSAPLFVASALMLGLLCALGLFFVLVNRMWRRRDRVARAEPSGRPTDARPANRAATARLDLSRRESDELLENARLLARDNPAKTANLLRSWLKND